MTTSNRGRPEELAYTSYSDLDEAWARMPLEQQIREVHRRSIRPDCDVPAEELLAEAHAVVALLAEEVRQARHLLRSLGETLKTGPLLPHEQDQLVRIRNLGPWLPQSATRNLRLAARRWRSQRKRLEQTPQLTAALEEAGIKKDNEV